MHPFENSVPPAINSRTSRRFAIGELIDRQDPVELAAIGVAAGAQFIGTSRLEPPVTMIRKPAEDVQRSGVSAASAADTSRNAISCQGELHRRETLYNSEKLANSGNLPTR
jgi:hypothetical protein